MDILFLVSDGVSEDGSPFLAAAGCHSCGSGGAELQKRNFCEFKIRSLLNCLYKWTYVIGGPDKGLVLLAVGGGGEYGGGGGDGGGGGCRHKEQSGIPAHIRGAVKF